MKQKAPFSVNISFKYGVMDEMGREITTAEDA